MKFFLRVHKKFSDSHGEYIILSCSKNKLHSRPALSDQESKSLVDKSKSYMYVYKIKSSEWDCKSHKVIEWNDTKYHVVTCRNYIGMPADWRGVFDHPDAANLIKTIKFENHKTAYLIPDYEFLMYGMNEDDDPSYTEGYRMGYTGLRWL